MIRTLASRASGRIPRSRLLARLLFGIDFAPLGADDYYFDVTTIVLVRRVVRELDAGARVLDMGTGSRAVVALALWKRLGCRVVASDVNPMLVELARENVQRNQAPVPVVCSRYFDQVPSDLTTVIFNPPYVRTATGERRGLSHLRRSQWDGGATGMEVMQGYFQELEKLARSVTTYLGLNYRHVPREAVLSLLASFPSLRVRTVHRAPFLPVDVYTLTNRATRKEALPPGEAEVNVAS